MSYEINLLFICNSEMKSNSFVRGQIIRYRIILTTCTDFTPKHKQQYLEKSIHTTYYLLFQLYLLSIERGSLVFKEEECF